MDTASDWFIRQMSDIRARHGRRLRSQRAFAERLDRLDAGISKKALERLEAGRRARGVTLDEALALAYALNTAPVHLMTPRDDDTVMEITPEVKEPARDVRAWIRGERPLPGVNKIAYRAEVPESERSRTPTTVLRELVESMDVADVDRRRYMAGLLIAVVREFWDPREVEWRTGETETELMQMIDPGGQWEQPS